MSQLATAAKENAVAKADPKKATVLDLIRQQERAIEIALPAHVSSERFTRTVLTEVRRNPQLLKCDPMSLLGAVMLSAQLGLELGPLGHAYLVPFKSEVTFIIGYKGMVDLARRSGQVSSIQAYAVKEGDDFAYTLGLNPDIRHVPSDGPADRPITHVYAVARYKDGGFNFVVLTKDEVDSYMARSPSARSNSSPWKSDYEPMALKTAIRRLFRWLPVTPEISTITTVADEVVPRGISTDVVSDLALEAPGATEEAEDDGIEDAELVDDDDEEPGT